LHMTWPRRGAQAILTTTQQPTPMRVAVLLHAFCSSFHSGLVVPCGLGEFGWLRISALRPSTPWTSKHLTKASRMTTSTSPPLSQEDCPVPSFSWGKLVP
jgi:hypothetical protein